MGKGFQVKNICSSLNGLVKLTNNQIVPVLKVFFYKHVHEQKYKASYMQIWTNLNQTFTGKKSMTLQIVMVI